MKAIFSLLICVGIVCFSGCDRKQELLPMKPANFKKDYEATGILKEREKDTSKKEDKSK